MLILRESRQGVDKHRLPGQILCLLVALKLCWNKADPFPYVPLWDYYYTKKGSFHDEIYQSANLTIFTIGLSPQKPAAVPYKEGERDLH